MPCNNNATTNPNNFGTLNNPDCSSATIACLNHGDHLCATCFTGYHLNKAVCQMNTCTCSNGDPAIGPVEHDGMLCESHGSAKCRACDTGYHLDNFECPMNVCTCQNGNGVVGPVSHDGQLCDNHNDAKCLSCDTGYHLDNFECPINVCNCNNGVGAVGPNESCDTHNSFKCVSCDEGYSLSGNVCVLNVCSCTNGGPVIGPVSFDGQLCENPGDPKCASCNAGFYLNNFACDLKICTCSGGVGMTGIFCPAHGTELCLSCDTGFNLVNNLCEPESILAGNPHEGENCEYYGLDVDQRGNFFKPGGSLSYSYDNNEQAWRLTTGGSGSGQWIGWQSATFANREFRATFEAKFLAARTDTNNDGFKVYGQFHDQWLKDASQNVGTWVSADVVATVPSSGDGNHILLIFDKAPADVLIKDFVMSYCDL